jgi:adenylate cyclase
LVHPARNNKDNSAAMSGELPKIEASLPPPAADDAAVQAPVHDTASRDHSGHSHAHLPHIQGLLDKIKKRNVGRVAVLYIGVCYIILEPFEMFFHLLELPAWTGRAIVLIMVVGFPAALFVAWIYELTPTGIKPSAEVDPQRSIARQTGRKLDRAIIAVLAFALVYFVADKFLPSKPAAKEEAAAVAVAVPAPIAGTAALPAISDKSVAVLPFVDMSEKRDQEYFSDGLSEELIDKLTKIAELRVPARTSSFFFKGKQTTIGDIAKALGVAYVLEGSVRKAGKTLRITAQLIKADAGYHVWSETYDRPANDIFKVQDEIASAVVGALKISLLPANAVNYRTQNIEANDLYLKAVYNVNQLSADGTARAVELLYQALILDPNFALAWAALSRSKRFQAAQGLVPQAQLPATQLEARRAAEKSVALMPSLAEGHVALGRIYLLDDQNLPKAAAELRRAQELDPHSADVLLQLGYLAGYQGRLDERIKLQERALAMDPLNVNTLDVVGSAYMAVGNFAAAVPLFRRELDLSPENMFAKSNLGYALALYGKPAEALDMLEQIVRSDAEARLARALLYPELGRAAEADVLLASLENDPGTITPLDFAELYAYRKDSDRAFQWLERAYQADPKKLRASIGTDPFFVQMREDPRFKALIRKLHLPE